MWPFSIYFRDKRNIKNWFFVAGNFNLDSSRSENIVDRTIGQFSYPGWPAVPPGLTIWAPRSQFLLEHTPKGDAPVAWSSAFGVKYRDLFCYENLFLEVSSYAQQNVSLRLSEKVHRGGRTNGCCSTKYRNFLLREEEFEKFLRLYKKFSGQALRVLLCSFSCVGYLNIQP